MIKLTVVSAALKKDIETFSKQDPYCKCSLGAVELKTTVKDNAGKTPKWDETLDFKVDGEPTFDLEIWDKESLKKDRIICKFSAPLSWSDFISIQNSNRDFPVVSPKGADFGTVTLKVQLIEDKPAPPPDPATEGKTAKPAAPAAPVAGTVEGTLKLTIHQAKELKDMETFGKQDPYCTMAIGEQKQKTKVHTDGGKSASWEESFTFNLEKGQDTLRLECFDKEMVKKDDFIGGVTLSIASLLAKAKEPQWFNLEGKDKNAGKKHGEIMVTAELMPAGADDGGNPNASAVEHTPYTGSQPGVVKLTVHKGRNLKNTEMVGKQDPYVKLAIASEKFKTKVHTDGGLNPVWEQTFTFNIDEAAEKFQMEVWDSEATMDDFIGLQVIPLTKLLSAQGVPTWFEIRGRGKNKDIIHGEIMLTAVFMPPVEAPKSAAEAGPLWVSQDGILKLTMHKGKDLYNTSLMGKQDPFVKLKVGTSEAKTKTHNKGGKFPSWEQDFTMNIMQGDTHLHLECWDEETVSNDFIGEVDLPLTKVLRSMKVPVWYEIFGRKDKSQQKRGELMMTAEFFPSGDAPKENAEVDLATMADPKYYNSSMSGTLELVLHKGKNLYDTNLVGKQDPFCKLKVGREQVKSKTHSRGGKFPSWEQTFAFTVEEGEDMLSLECWDEETVSDDFIGEAKLPLAKLLHLPNRPCWYMMKGRGKNAQKDTGEIMITAKWTADVDDPSVVPLPDKLDGMLKLTVFKGRDLYNTSMMGKQDPFVEIIVGEEKLKTKTHSRGGQFPVWGEDFTVSITPEMNFVEFVAWDWETVSNDFIGTTKVLLKDLLAKQKKPKWYKIHGRKEKAEEPRGELMIAAEFYGAGESVGGKGDEYKAGDVGTLQLTAHKAQNLYNTEMFGKQDPYCKGILGDIKQQTKVHTDGGKNPRWEEKMTFNVTPTEDTIKVEVWDKEMVDTDDFIGEFSIPLTKLLEAQGPPEWHTLFGRKGKESEEKGKILMSARFFSPKGDEEAIQKKVEVAAERDKSAELKAAEDAKAKAEAEAAAAKAKADAEAAAAKAKAESDRKKAESRKKREEERRAKEAEDAKLKAEAEAKALEEAKRLAEADKRRKAETARKVREAREKREREAAEAKAREEALRKAQEDAERAKREQLRKAKEERLRKAREEEERQKAEEERKQQEAEEARRKAREEKRKAKEAAKKAMLEAKRKAKAEEEERLRRKALNLLSVEVRFTDMDIADWESNKGPIDRAFIEGIAETTGLKPEEFSDVAIKAGSVLATTQFVVEGGLIESIQASLDNLDFLDKLLCNEPFDEPILTVLGPAEKKIQRTPKPQPEPEPEPKVERPKIEGKRMVLKLTVHRCKNLKDSTEYEGGVDRQDPFAKIKLNGQKYTTPAHKGGGTYPVFNKTYLFPLGTSTQTKQGMKEKLKIEIWDAQRSVSDVFLGEVGISLKKLSRAPSPSWWPLEGRESNGSFMAHGQILLEAELLEDSGSKSIEFPASASTMPYYRLALQHLMDGGAPQQFDVPTILVTGLRGNGKTSLVSCLSGLYLPAGNMGATRCAMEISMECSHVPGSDNEDDWETYSQKHGFPEYYPPSSPSEPASLNLGSVDDNEAWLRGSDRWRACLTIRSDGSNLDLLPYVHKLDAPSELYQAIADAQSFVARSREGFYSTSTIQIQVRGPSVPDLSIVDIPGIANDPTTQEIAASYLAGTESIVLAVCSCEEGSIDRQDNLLRFLRKHVGTENMESRVIGVLTKPDHIEDCGDYWLDLVEGKAKPRGLGPCYLPWFVVKPASSHSHMHPELPSPMAVLDSEKRFFNKQEPWNAIGPYRKQVGTWSLKKVLSDILDRRLYRMVGSVQKAISYRQSVLEEELQSLELGLDARNKSAVISKALYSMVADFDQKLKREVFATRDSYANYADVLWTGSALGEQNVHPVVFAATATAASHLGELGSRANDNKYMYTHVRELFQKFKDEIAASRPKFDETEDEQLTREYESSRSTRNTDRPRSQRSTRYDDFGGEGNVDRYDRDEYDDRSQQPYGDRYRNRHDWTNGFDRPLSSRATSNRSRSFRSQKQDTPVPVPKTYFERVKRLIVAQRERGIGQSVSNSVVHSLIQEFVTAWRPGAFQCLSDVRDLMQAKLFVLVRDVFGKYHKLESTIAKKCRELLDREYKQAQAQIKHFFEMEAMPFTSNTRGLHKLKERYLNEYLDNYRESEITAPLNAENDGYVDMWARKSHREVEDDEDAEEVVDSFSRSRQSTRAVRPTTPAQATQVLTELRRLGFSEEDYPAVTDIAEAHPGLVPIITQKICGSRKSYSDEQQSGKLHEDVFEVISSVKAYYSIASRRFADYIPMSVDLSMLVKYLKKLEDELIPEICDASSTKDSLSSLMEEDPAQAARRQQLHDQLACMEQARKALSHG